MPKRLLIAADVDRSFLALAASDSRFEIVSRPVTSERELIESVGDCQIVVTRSYNPVTEKVIAAARQLELIAQGTSGTDNIDLTAAAEREIAVISLPGENANAVAELMIGFMIALTRTVPLYDRHMRYGLWQREDCATRHELRHYRLGIVGLGEVGKRVAGLAAKFGVHVAAFDPYLTDEVFVERGSRRIDSLHGLLTSSDIVTLHVPLTHQTRRMISSQEIRWMPRGSFLINASRGEVLDQAAALAALSEGWLAGVALDVYDPEPPSLSFPDDPRLILTPHIAGCSFEAKSSIGTKLYEKIVRHYWNETS